MSITVYFPQNAYRVKCFFFFFCPNLCRIPPPSQAHSFTLTQPSVVWVPAYMIVIPDLTALGLEPQRQPEKGQRCQRAQSHSLSASLLPIPLLSHSLARTCPSPPPPKPLFLPLSPLLPPVRCKPNGWVMSKHRQSSTSTARLAASLQSQRAATLLGGACGRGRLWGL